MVDPADALHDPVNRPAEHGQVQRDWIVDSVESGRRAKEALDKAAEVLAATIIGRPPDTGLMRAWAEIAQAWASLSQAEATRSIAAATRAADQSGVNAFPAT